MILNVYICRYYLNVQKQIRDDVEWKLWMNLKFIGIKCMIEISKYMEYSFVVCVVCIIYQTIC